MYITEEEKRMAINLAMKIDIGEVTLSEVIFAFDKFPLSARAIMAFWMSFNEMTKEVAERVGYEKCREHLEKCYKKESKWHQKTIFYGLTRIILKLRKII